MAAMGFAGAAQALDYGPFTLTGFAKGEFVRGSNHCLECQRFPTEDKQRVWADELAPGQPYGTSNTHVVLAQPWLAAKFDLGKGFKLTGLASQRWRDGKEDIPGYWYEKNVAVSHEEYGRLAVGAMTTRAWSLADYPYGTNIGVADVWGSSGAGYGLNTKAVRYTSRTWDVLDGDLVVEATYDQGNTAFKKNKPRYNVNLRSIPGRWIAALEGWATAYKDGRFKWIAHRWFEYVTRDHQSEAQQWPDRKSTRLNSSHIPLSRMPSSA